MVPEPMLIAAFEAGTTRVLRSFSRRLSYLHEDRVARSIVGHWFAEDGILGNPTSLDDDLRAMFDNAAAVLPDRALELLETFRGQIGPDAIEEHSTLILNLAYEPETFSRAALLLLYGATGASHEQSRRQNAEAFKSLFGLYLSGTRAPIETRMELAEALVRSGNDKFVEQGLDAISRALEAIHFSSGNRFEFGARQRDFGFVPKSRADIVNWYTRVFDAVRRLGEEKQELREGLYQRVARAIRAIWTRWALRDEIEAFCRHARALDLHLPFHAACRETIYFDELHRLPESEIGPPRPKTEARERMERLAEELEPRDPVESALLLIGVRAPVAFVDPDEFGDPRSGAGKNYELVEQRVRELGRDIAADESHLTSILPELVAIHDNHGSRASDFGRGLAEGATNVRRMWARITDVVAATPKERVDTRLLFGFLGGVSRREPDAAHEFLDEVIDHPILRRQYPWLQCAAGLGNAHGARLRRSLDLGHVPVDGYRCVSAGGVSRGLADDELVDILDTIAARDDGRPIAAEILGMRLFREDNVSPALTSYARSFLLAQQRDDEAPHHHTELILNAAFKGTDAEPFAIAFGRHLLDTYSTYGVQLGSASSAVQALLKAFPIPILDLLLLPPGTDGWRPFRTRDSWHHDRNHLGDAVDRDTWLAWCRAAPEWRFLAAANIVTFRAEDGGSAGWSETAIALMRETPEPIALLRFFVDRFRPGSWSGSMAETAAANLPLFDALRSTDIRIDPMELDGVEREFQEWLDRVRAQEAEEEKERTETFE